MGAILHSNSKVFRNIRTFDGEMAMRTHIATLHGRALIAERDEETGDLHIYHVASASGGQVPTQTIGETNKVGDGNSWLEGPEATRVRRLAEMNENEREDATRRAIEQGLLTAVEAERMRESSVKWNAEQTTTDRRPARLSAPRTSISVERMMKNAAEARSMWDKMCGCGRGR
jgi:hypothetical protein